MTDLSEEILTDPDSSLSFIEIKVTSLKNRLKNSGGLFMAGTLIRSYYIRDRSSTSYGSSHVIFSLYTSFLILYSLLP